IRTQEIALQGMTKEIEKEKAIREEQSAPTVSQAQQKNAAELDKAITEAKIARLSLADMPTPQEARTKRAADLLETQAKTAEAQASTAEKRAQPAIIGAQPVFAFDPATKQRVLTTMPEANAKGFTNPVKASEGDINKETELTRQFNDVQLKVTRYENALKN